MAPLTRCHAVLIGVAACLACAPSGPADEAGGQDPAGVERDVSGSAPFADAMEIEPAEGTPEAEVRRVVRAFYRYISAFDVAAIDTLLTDEFRIVDGGRRFDGPGFASFLEGLQARGLEFDFELSDWSTRVDGTVAYTLLRSVNRRLDAAFHDSAILLRDGAQWRLERFHSTPAR